MNRREINVKNDRAKMHKPLPKSRILTNKAWDKKGGNDTNVGSKGTCYQTDGCPSARGTCRCQ